MGLKVTRLHNQVSSGDKCRRRLQLLPSASELVPTLVPTGRTRIVSDSESTRGGCTRSVLSLPPREREGGVGGREKGEGRGEGRERGGEAESRTDRQATKQTDRRTGRHAGRYRERGGREGEREGEGERERETDRQTDRQTETETDS